MLSARCVPLCFNDSLALYRGRWQWINIDAQSAVISMTRQLATLNMESSQGQNLKPCLLIGFVQNAQ